MADGDIPVAKLLVNKAPLILKTTASHVLGLSDNSSKWSLKVELLVTIIRSFWTHPNPWPITKQQSLSLKDAGIKGKLWIAKAVIAAPPEEEVRAALLGAVDALKEKDAIYTIPETKSVSGEWTGYRPGVSGSSARPKISEAEQYARLMKDTKNDTTVMYIHGGALYLMDPATHRTVCSRLAKETGGRCFSVRYRLAPQNPFPAALLDVFIAYLSLLAPPPGSFHTAVPANKIVFSGDSAGGNLSLSLCQLLMQIRRSSLNPSVRFHGVNVPIELPAGLALNSPWTDLTACMPSVTGNLKYDYLPPPDPRRLSALPTCDAWPTNPPREDIYCAASMLCHPLVSPLAAPTALWQGAPPAWFVIGDECLYDEGAVVASRLLAAGTPVEWWHFEAMPHVFAAMFPGSPESRICFESWGRFIQRVTNNVLPSKQVTGGVMTDKSTAIESKATYIRAKSVKRSALDVSKLAPLGDAEVASRMTAAQSERETMRQAAKAEAEEANVGEANVGETKVEETKVEEAKVEEKETKAEEEKEANGANELEASPGADAAVNGNGNGTVIGAEGVENKTNASTTTNGAATTTTGVTDTDTADPEKHMNGSAVAPLDPAVVAARAAAVGVKAGESKL